MTNPFEDDSAEYCVLMNDEDQYSLWPTSLEIPRGWREVGPRGERQKCLSYIEENWTDMRPRSLVEQMNRDAAERMASSSETDGMVH